MNCPLCGHPIEDDPPDQPENPVLLREVEELEMSVRAYNVVHNNKIVTIGDLIQRTPYDLLLLKNCGTVTVVEIMQILKALDLKLRMPSDSERRHIVGDIRRKGDEAIVKFNALK